MGKGISAISNCLAVLFLPAALLAEQPTAYETGLAAVEGKDYVRARQAFEAAHAAGDLRAASALAELLWIGLGGEQDFARACDYLEEAALSGSLDAMHNFAGCFFHGKGRSRDYAKSKEWYERAIAGQFARSYCALGNQYRDALGVERDLKKAKQLCQQGAELGSPDAMTDLGKMFLDERDFERAAHWLKPAAEAAQINAMRYYGIMLLNGDGVPRDGNAAREWLTRAVDAGDRQAPFFLGRLFFKVGVDIENKKIDPEWAWLAALWFGLAQEIDPNERRRTHAMEMAESIKPLLPPEYIDRLNVGLTNLREKMAGHWR